MRSIFYVIGTLDIGGAERHLAQLARYLAPQRWHPTIACLSGRGALIPELRQSGIEILEAPCAGWAGRAPRFLFRPLRLLIVSLWLLRVLRQRRPDVVHFFLPASYLIGAPCALLAGCRRLVMSRRSLNFYQRRRWGTARLERWLHGRMVAVLGNSEAVVRDLRAEGVPAARLRMISNGVDLARFSALPDRAAARRKLGIADSCFVMVIVANLIPYKGHRDLLAALGIVGGRLPQPWRLLCVGRDDGIGDALRAEAARYGIGGNIAWLGVREDVPELLAAANLALLCSHEEGFSNAVLEAMAAGLPVVATDVGGNREAVIDGVTGIIVPPHDPGRLGEAILEIAHAGEQACAMGRAGRARIAEHFAIESAFQRYEALYEELLDGDGARLG
ncbi:MAG TPA: glycosyltransferase [Alphaproteobacteria bacterium]|nr:glycosyltransferase [Alphaproteobacteria bacterium]